MPLSRALVLKTTGLGLALLGLAACATTPPVGYRSQAVLPTEQYAVKVSERPEELALGVHAEGLSTRQLNALTDFVSGWRSAGGGVMVVRSPADSADGETAKSMTYAVQSQLEGLGVPSDHIQLASYNAGVPHGPVVASYQRLTAQGPDCRGGWDDVANTMTSTPYTHFGCAITANMAAEVADPRDFVSPSPLAAGDLTRREVVLGKYRDGKVTASEKDDQASGAVSSAVKQ